MAVPSCDGLAAITSLSGTAVQQSFGDEGLAPAFLPENDDIGVKRGRPG
jgi:hypothetical protein